MGQLIEAKWTTDSCGLVQCEAPKIAKLVHNSNNYGLLVLVTIVNGVYKPTYNWGGHTLYEPLAIYPLVICYTSLLNMAIFNGNINCFDWAIFNSEL